MFIALQGLRALAALMVATCHLISRLVKHGVVEPHWMTYTGMGSAGVFVFFAISGFIMIKTAGGDFGSPGSPSRFFKRRLVRIIPIYYVFTLLYVLKLCVTGEAWSVRDLALSLLFVPYLNDQGLMQPVYGLGWSLNYEMYFYAVFAGCMYLGRRVGITAVFLIVTAILFVGQGGGAFTENGDPQDLLGFFGAPVVLYFLGGMAVGLAPQVPLLSPASCFVIASSLLIASVIIAEPSTVALACLVTVFVASLERPSKTEGNASDEAMIKLGDASYSIYLTHSFVLGPAVALGLKLGLLNAWLALPFSLVAICACALVGLAAFAVLERPILGRLRATLLSAPAPASVPSSIARYRVDLSRGRTAKRSE